MRNAAGSRLDFSYGTKEDAPVKSGSRSPHASAQRIGFHRCLRADRDDSNWWQWAGLISPATPGRAFCSNSRWRVIKKGLGLWGSPTVEAAGGGNVWRGPAWRKPRGVIFLVTDTLRKDHQYLRLPPGDGVHLKKFADKGCLQSRHFPGNLTKVSVYP